MKIKSLIAVLLLTASNVFAQIPSYVPTNGLVGWWPFNGNANDESGNGNNGTVNGATLTSDRFGSNNKAYNFVNANNYISIPSFNWYSNNGFSFSFWVNLSSISNDQLFIKHGTAFGGNGNGIYMNLFNSSVFLTSPTNQGQGAVTPQNPFSSNSWVMITYSVELNSFTKIFINGNPISTTAYNGILTSIITPSTPIYFGKDVITNSQQLIGQLDDIGIWNRALTQQEITTLYNAQSCTGTGAITPDGPTTFCAGNYVNLTSDVVGGSYQWKKNGVNITTNGTSRTYKATATGSYTCVATCIGTALTSNAISVTSKTNAFASVAANGATSFCAGDSVTLNCTNLGSNYSVQWYRTNISMENATAYSQVVKQPGTYKVVTKNLTTGCSRISGSSVVVAVNCRLAGDISSAENNPLNANEARLMDNELSQGVHIFPNPNNGLFTFSYDGEEYGDAVLQVMNSMGQMIYNTNVSINEGGYTQELQLGDTATKGIYIVRLLINGNSYDSRVLVR